MRKVAAVLVPATRLSLVLKSFDELSLFPVEERRAETLLGKRIPRSISPERAKD